MKYALLIYSREAPSGGRPSRAMPPGVAAVLARPEVTGYARLEATEAATTVRLEDRGTFLTDGPFVDSKEFLGGLIFVEAADLDRALAIAAELQELDITEAIEVRPVFDQELGGA